ncbi:MAG: hypothetical protein RIG77_24245 [Cyclobacteriaceae bacterium]
MKVILLANPLNLELGDRASFVIGIEVFNDTEDEIIPELDKTELLINGEASNSWSRAIKNGKREPNWCNLSAGQKISMKWTHLGETLFRNPGFYHLQLKLGNQILDSLDVKINSL